MRHCLCCHSLYDDYADGRDPSDERFGWCRECNYMGCSPGCYAFEFSGYCNSCGGQLTEVQVDGGLA